MRVAASDYYQLPVVFQDIPVELPDSALRKYKQMEATLQADIKSGVVTAANAAVASGKCRQIASGFLYDDQRKATWLHDAKFDALSELLEELHGKPVLIFYNFVETAELLIQRFGAQIIKGAATETQRELLNAWNRGEVPILAAHPASAGHGLNLQDGGHHIIWFDPTWNLEDYLQANARLHRQGQKYTVYIHRLVARGTLEQAIVKRLESKDKLQSDLLSALRDYWANA
jgi:SNF2 family DNA or RNA helicase